MKENYICRKIFAPLHSNQMQIFSSELRFSEYQFIKNCQCHFLCAATEEHLFSFCLLNKILYLDAIEYIYLSLNLYQRAQKPEDPQFLGTGPVIK